MNFKGQENLQKMFFFNYLQIVFISNKGKFYIQKYKKEFIFVILIH